MPYDHLGLTESMREEIEELFREGMVYTSIKKEIFHVHTWRCKHAGDYTDEQYIEKAIELGADRIVFTDHAPFPGNPFGNRMDFEQLPEYIETINGLKEIYKGRIEILCGLEVEYLPSYANYIRELRNTPKIDVMVLGQHFYEHEPGKYSFTDKDTSMEFEGLCDAMIQGVGSQCFDIIAHPDRAFRRRKQFGARELQAAQKLIKAACNYGNTGIYLERNFASMRRKHQYWQEFWDLVPETTPIIYGFDAHCIADLERESLW